MKGYLLNVCARNVSWGQDVSCRNSHTVQLKGSLLYGGLAFESRCYQLLRRNSCMLTDKSFSPVCQKVWRVAALLIWKWFFLMCFFSSWALSLNAKIVTLFTSEILLSWIADLVLLEVRNKRIHTVCRWKAFLLNGLACGF